MFEEYFPFIWTAIGLGAAFVFARMFVASKLAFLKTVPRTSNEKEDTGDVKNFSQQFDSFVDNAPNIAKGLEMQIRQLEQNNVTKEQLQPLLLQKKIADTFAANPMLGPFVKPFAKMAYGKVLGMVKEFGT